MIDNKSFLLAKTHRMLENTILGKKIQNMSLYNTNK